jgi:hypothetical protein
MRSFILNLTRILAVVALVLTNAGVVNAQSPHFNPNPGVNSDSLSEGPVCSRGNAYFYNQERCECLRNLKK